MPVRRFGASQFAVESDGACGAGSFFMIFGEPDLELRAFPDGKLQVELRGLDVYDPTTGEIRSSATVWWQ